MVGITSYGGYLPRLRLSRKAIADAMAWMNPGLAGQARGERTMANWDEDSVTMAVEAGRDCVPEDERGAVDGIYFASTTMPFADRQNAGILVEALRLNHGIPSIDISNVQRAGTTALIQGLTAVKGGLASSPIVVASDKRFVKAGGSQEMLFGDGAAALRLGSENVIAEFLGSYTHTVDFVDHYRGEESASDGDIIWEDRWIRDEGWSKIVPTAIQGALDHVGIKGGDVDHLVMPCVYAKLPQKIAKQCGINPDAIRDNLHAGCGECGTAHALVMLVHALQEVGPGKTLALVGFGQGCDVLFFKTTDAVSKMNGPKGVTGSLANRREETNYMKWLAFNDLVKIDAGSKGTGAARTALSVLYRNEDMLMGLVGGKCTKCGTVQYPRERICVNPNCHSVDSQEPYSLAEKTGKILSWTANQLGFSMDPPAHYGMVTFQEGGRLMMDFTEVQSGEVESGMEVKLVFRVKQFDDQTGFRNYFWKAIPIGEAAAGAQSAAAE